MSVFAVDAFFDDPSLRLFSTSAPCREEDVMSSPTVLRRRHSWCTRISPCAPSAGTGRWQPTPPGKGYHLLGNASLHGARGPLVAGGQPMGGDWGEDGVFRIVWGENQCKIESLIQWSLMRRREARTTLQTAQNDSASCDRLAHVYSSRFELL